MLFMLNLYPRAVNQLRWFYSLITKINRSFMFGLFLWGQMQSLIYKHPTETTMDFVASDIQETPKPTLQLTEALLNNFFEYVHQLHSYSHYCVNSLSVMVKNFLLTSHYLYFDYTFCDKKCLCRCFLQFHKVLPTFSDPPCIAYQVYLILLL